MKKSLFFIASALIFIGCSNDPVNSAYVKEQSITEESVKSISSQIDSAGVYQQYAGEYNGLTNIDVYIASGTSSGGVQAWNGAAVTIFSLSKTLLFRDDVGKITFTISNNEGQQWGKVEVSKAMLPDRWGDLTYLEFFSHVHPSAIDPDAAQWLDEFYTEYNSAMPK